jgi:hypothetical protein
MSNLVRNHHSGIKLIRPSQVTNNYLDGQMQIKASEYPDSFSISQMKDQKIPRVRRDQLKTFNNNVA